MRDLYKTLEVCATEDAMDFCPEFDDIKSELEFCNQHVKSFKKLVFRSGNDSIINELTRRLQERLVKRQLVDPDDKTPLPKAYNMLRKILMFFFANTDVIYKYNLRDDPRYVHVIGICPLLPKFLTIALVWELQLDDFFFEALTFTPVWYAFQYFEAANESLKYIDDAYKVLNVIEKLLRALLTNIERSAMIQMDAVDQKIIFNKLYDQAAILLRRFNTPDANVIEKMKKREQHRYCGHKINHLLEMTLFAFDLYESKYQITPNFDTSVYSIGEVFHKVNPQIIGYNRAAKEEELRITLALLSTLQNCVMNVNMDSFIEWVEVDISPTLTLQQAIGEMAFRVRKHINENAAFEHSVESVLKPIEIRPKSLTEVITESNIGEILRNLDDSTKLPYETKKLWFDELFLRGEITLGNDECLQTINDNLKLMTPKNCEEVIKYIKLKRECANLLESNDDDGEETDENEELVELLLSAMKQFTNENILNLLMFQQKAFGELYDGIVTSKSDTFEQRATEFLNKCTTVFDLQHFLLLCFEHPLRMWSEFFSSAGHAIEHVRHFSETVRKTIPYSYIHVDRILKEAVLQTTQPVYFPELLCEIYFILYRNEHKVDFLAKFINGHMKSCLDAEDYESLLPIIKALNLITQRNGALNLDELTAPMLAMVAVVADLARWNLTNFNNVRVELVGLCINFISVSLERFLPIATEKDRKWLSSKIKSTCMPFTQYYFQSIFGLKSADALSFDRFLCSEEKLDIQNAVHFLIKVLVRCTSFEFKSLAGSPRFSPFIFEAIHQLTINVKSDPIPNAILNLRHCLANFMIVLNDILKPKCSNGRECYDILHSTLELIAEVPNEMYDQIFMETEGLLKDMLTNTKEQFSKEKLKDLLDFVKKMPACTAKNIFLQTLNTSISSG